MTLTRTCLALGIAWIFGIHLESTAADSAGVEFFENKIRPVLVDRCYECHSAQSEKLKGGLRLDTRNGWEKGGASGPAIAPGKPAESLLIQVLKGTAHDVKRMPSKGDPLPDAQIAAFEEWVAMGAPDPRSDTTAAKPAVRNHWAFQPPRPPAAPALRNPGWVRTELDRFVLAQLEAHGLEPSPAADRRTLLRRVTQDLTGLPPTPAEMAAFLSDTSPEAYARVVDRLLASPRYGERWARHWLDVARYADTKGYVFEEERRYAYSYTYRDWVVSALNQDLPYDEFIVAQIAGDRIASETNRAPLAAMGFLTLGRRFLNNPPDIIDDRIDVVFRGLQGLTVQCARCHDHKYDPIPTADYYSLYGVFSNSHEPAEKPLLGANPNPTLAGKYEEERQRRQKELQDFRTERTAAVFQKLRERVADYLLTAQESLGLDWTNLEGLARTRSLDPGLVAAWKERLEKWRGQSHPIFAPWFAYAAATTNDFVGRSAEVSAALREATWENKPVNLRIATALSERPPTNFTEVAQRIGQVILEADTAWQSALSNARTNQQPAPPGLPDAAQEQLRQLLHADDSPVLEAMKDIDRFFDTPTGQKLRALRRKLDELDALDPGAPLRAMSMTENASFSDPVIFKRGNPGNHGPKVPRQQLAIVAGPDRKPFTDGSGRLDLARSIASRDNPLTARVLVNRVWLRHFGSPLVKTPSDFGVRSDPPTNPALLDHLAVWFMDHGWSLKSLHRHILLSAAYQQSSDPETAGVSAARIAAAEQIDPVNQHYWRMNRQRLDFEAMRDSLLAVSGQLDLTVGGQAVPVYETGSPKSRRTLYAFLDRQNLPGILRSFDFANPDATSAMRYQTTVPQQALFWLNSDLVASQARALNQRPDIAALDADARITRLYQQILQRPPGLRETELARRFIKAGDAEPPQPHPGAAWSYGLGHYDAITNRTANFRPLTVFRDDAWRGGDKFPVDGPRGHVSLTKTGGHPGRDRARSAVRRWTAPLDGPISIRGSIKHPATEGDGVVARIVSSRSGLLGEFTVLHRTQAVNVERVEVRQGDTIDFIVEAGGNDGFDSFEWAPELRTVNDTRGERAWLARTDFSGPRTWPAPLNPWERLAQALLASNEFSFVD
jgi:hypothetical protein